MININKSEGRDWDLISFVHCDLGGVVRGRSFPARDLKKKLCQGVGWVPINQTITPYDKIPNCPLWGSTGDVRLLADPDTEILIPSVTDAPPLHFVLCDVTNLDGAPWDVCARTLLKQAISDLERETGLSLMAAFEHEFMFVDVDVSAGPGFSLRAQRSEAEFADRFCHAMTVANLDLEMFLAEFGAGQFEFTSSPTHALTAADRSVASKEIARDIAAQMRRRISFAPKPFVDRMGNGVHIHMSLWDRLGNPVGYDPSQPGGMSLINAQFAAGIAEHLMSMMAILAPSVSSYHRLIPHAWSSAYVCVGDRNREAAVRICPVTTLGGGDVSRQFNLEIRPIDATANPYLALAALIYAGLDGIKRQLPARPLMNGDPSALSPENQSAMGIKRLPQSLNEALKLFKDGHAATKWLSPAMSTSYIALKEEELRHMSAMLPEQIAELTRHVF